MNIFKTIPLKYKIAIIVCYILPIIILHYLHGYTESIWNLLVIPTIIFSYYFGLRGGIISSIVNIIFYGIIEFLKYTSLHGKPISSNINVYIFASIILLVTAVGTGLLAEKLKKLISILEFQKEELLNMNKELQSYWDETQKILGNIGATIWSHDLRQKKFVLSSKENTVFGWPVEEIVNDSDLFEKTFKKDIKHMSKYFTEDLSTDVKILEREIVRKDGQERWIRNHHTAVMDENEHPYKINGIIIDITDQKNLEKKLQSIIEFLPDATMVVDKDLKVIAWNKAIEEMTGVEKQEIMGKGGHAYTLPLFGETRPCLIDLVFKQDQEIELNYEGLTRKGSLVCGEIYTPLANQGKGAYVWATASAIYDDHGNVVGAIECIRDITDKKKLENNLKESEQRYRALVELSPLPIVVQRQGTIEYVNRTANNFLHNLGLEDIMGQTIYNFFGSNNIPEINSRLEKALKEGPQFAEQKVEVNNQSLDIRVATAAIQLNGETAIMSVIQDITEQKQAVEAIKKYNEVLKHEMELAAKVQKNMLPLQSPQIAGLQFAWEFKPSTFISGDMFNVLTLNDYQIGVYILDVMGHGLSAALQAVSINYFFQHSYSRSINIDADLFRPSSLLKVLNEIYIRQSITGKFFTIFYGVINTKTMEITYAKAGHPAPYVISEDGEIDELTHGGLPIGLFEDSEYEEYKYQLKSGDKLILYTDGIQTGKDFFIKHSLVKFLEDNRNLSLSQILKLLLTRTEQIRSDIEEDDIALLGIEIDS